MSKKNKNIAPEVRADIIRRVKEEGISVSQAAKDHGVADRTIYAWLGKGVEGQPSWSEFARLTRQNRELFEVVGELTVKLSAAQKKN